MIGGSCLTSVACRFHKELLIGSIVHSFLAGLSAVSVVLILWDSLKPNQLQFSHAKESSWAQALTMSMDAGFYQKKKEGTLQSEYGARTRASMYTPAEDLRSPAGSDVKRKGLGM